MKRKNASIQPDLFEQAEPRVLPALSQKEQLATLVEALLLEWDVDRFRVKGVPEMSKTMTELAFAAHNNVPPGMEPGLEAVSYYDPPNMTYPFGAYICVMNIDVDTGVYKVRRFYALDDCGTRINPMIIEGQVHGGLT